MAKIVITIEDGCAEELGEVLTNMNWQPKYVSLGDEPTPAAKLAFKVKCLIEGLNYDKLP